ncbi:MAG: sensor histidine kinase [Blastococcus sp.]|nr:sensor histidine kinase [Blastococcus sp.]
MGQAAQRVRDDLVPDPLHAGPVPAGPPSLPRWRRWAARHPRVVDGLVACAVQLIGLPATVHAAGQLPWAWLIDVALVLPLVWRRRHPRAVFGLLAAVALVQWAVGLRFAADAALLVARYTVAVGQSRRVAVAAVAVMEVGVVLAGIRFAPAGDALASVIFLSGLVAAAFFIGTTVQTRRAYLGELVDRAARAERERDQQARLAVTSERTRLARELHDIVAHSLTVVVTLAEAASAAGATDPPAAREAMGQVATTGRAALAEMRRLLGVLRTDDDEDPADLAPAPGLDNLDGVVAAARAAGLPVRLTVGGRPRPLTAAMDATAYRIVQESLTNVLKHAVEPSAVEVLVRWGKESLVLQVSDDGRSAVGTGEPGHGLSGMRERLALFGGELSAGPAAPGGWRVRAELPVAEEQA